MGVIKARHDKLKEKNKKKRKKNQGGILGGVGYVVGKAVTGALDVVEDTADVLIGGTADLLGFNEFAKKVHTDDYTDKWNYSLDEWYNPDSVVKTIGDIGSGIGQSATYVGLSLIPYAGPALAKTAMVGSGLGGGIQSAVEKTGNLGAKEYIYGGLSGATEVALESLTGAAGKVATKLAKPAAKGVKSVAKTIGKESAEALAKKGAKSAAKTVGRKGIIRTTLSGMGGEAFEEAASEYLNAKYQNWTGVDKDAKATLKDIAYSAFVGAMSGGALTAGSQGIKNASNLRKGTRIVENGNAEAAINTAKHFSKTLNLKAETSGANAERIRGQYSELLQQIDKAVDAYEKLPDADKEGTRARLYLGEIQETVAYVEMAAKSSEASIAYKLVLESKPEEAERYAKVVSTVTGKTVTADDIRNNTPMFGKLGAMDMLGAIKYAGEVAADAENSMIENERLNEMKNQAIEEANVGTDMEGAPLQTSPEVQTSTPAMKSTLFAKNPTLNAQVNPSVNPNTSVNTAENAQISTEAQAVAENANAQATTAETQNEGTEKVSIESKKDYDEWFAKNKVEKIRNSKHSSDKLVSAMLDNGIKPSQIFNYDAKSGSSTYNSKLGSIVLDMASNTEGKRAVSTDALAKSIKHNKKAINQLKVSDYDNRSQALLRLEAKILGNAIEIDGKPLPKWFLSLYGTNYGVSDRYADTGIEGAETSNEGNVKRSISAEEAETQRKESFDALLKEENAKATKKEEQKQKAKTAEQIQAEKEATKQAHWDAYTKARDEATLALGVDKFALMSAEARDRVTRMYMEISGVKGVTKETKKALASILAVRPGLYVFTTDKLADNGAWWYNKATGGRAIVINKNSGAITNTLLHEITHDLAKENSKHYENLSKAVLANTSKEDQQKVYDAYLMRHLRDYNQIDESTTLEEAKAVFKTLSKEQQKHFDDMVKEEITTRAVAEKLGNKNFLHEHGKEHRFAIMRAIAHLRKLGSSLVHRSEADKYVRQLEKNFAEAVGMGKSNVKIPSFVNIDEEDENHLTVMRSLESYLNAAHNEESGATRESGRDILLKYLTKTYGQGDAMQIVSQMDSIAEAMKAIESEHPELNIFSNWNSTQIEIDENGHPIFTTSIKNGDYKLNQDFSRVCKKRRQLDYVLNYLASRPDFYAEYLSKEDFVKINQAIKKHGFEIACDLCFVDAKRFRQTEWALSFTNTWNDLFESIYSSGTVIRFHFANDQNPSATDVEIDKNKPISYRKWTEGKVKSTVKYKSVADLLENEGNTQVKAMVRFMINHPEARGRFNANDIISSKGFDNIQRYSADLRKMLDGWQGSAAPKSSSSDTVYDNSIVNTEGYNAKTAFAMGGSRMNSFSDFMAHMFFDYCQAFSELAAKRMPVQSYTKELIFARLFGLTGAKINLSGVPAVRENATTDKDFEKSVAGLNLDRLAEHLGKSPEKLTKKEILANLDLCDYLWSKESINMKYATLLQSGIMYDRIMDESVIDECYSLIQEGKFDEAFALAGEENVNKKYAKHVGTIVVGVSEAHIRKLLRDNTVRMVIPYHRSGLNPTIAKAMKVAYYHDYTNVQSTRVQMKGKKSASKITSEAIKEEFALKDFDFYEYFGKNINGKVISGKAVARRYLEWCENGVYDEKGGDYVYYTKDGYILASEFHKKAKIVPKFSQFTNEENYYKLLEDFDVYDTITGKHSAQNSITFNANSLPSDYRSVLTGALEAEQNTYEDFISAFNNDTKLDGIGLGEEIMGIMDEARERVEGKTNIRRSINLDSPTAKIDQAYLEAVERGDMEAVQEMVDKAARAAGYEYKGYHGTKRGGFTVFKNRLPGMIDGIKSIFLAKDDGTAAQYAYGSNKKIYSLYAKMENPLVVDCGYSAANNISTGNKPKIRELAQKYLRDAWETKSPTDNLSTDQIGYLALRSGIYDGVIFKNVNDSYTYRNITDVYEVFEPEQVKSADPVTYDDNGNVIPLSQRFDSKETDIRRSINIEDRIISTHDDRTTAEKAKGFVKDVKSRGVKGNAQVAKSKGEDAFVKTQIQLTNAQAGIEYFLKQEGMSQLEVEASVNMVRMSARKGTAAITAKQTDINGNIIGEGFNEIMRPINKSNREDFKSYWVHKLNTYRAPRGKAVFKDVTAEQSAQEVKRLEKLHPEFKDVLEKLNEFDKNALQLAVDARLISQEQADAYHQLNPYYFPVVRFKDADPKKFKSGAFRFKNLNKQAKGGEADIVDPIEAYMDHIVTLERSAYINILANAIYDHEDGINVVSARERIPNFDKKLKDEGREGLIGMNYRDGIEPKSNTIVFFKDGEALAMDVSTEIMDGFRALQGDHNSYFDSAIGKANTAAIRLFSKLVTTYNPFFIIRNMVRDFQDAGIYSQFGLRKFAKTYATTAIYQIMTNGKYWQEYIANGGFDTSMFDYSLGTESNRIGLKKAQGNPLSQAATLFENTQIFVEQLPRFTEFLLSRQAGNDIKTSLYFAADVTVNFGRSGKLTKTLGKTLIPFLNPSVQGFSKNVRHLKDATNFKDYERWKKSAKSLLISAAALGIAPILLSNLMYEDDEEYQTLSDNIKTNYYLIRYGEGKYIRVPRGRLSSAFASVTNTTQSQVKKKKVDARQWMDTFENVMSNTTPFETATRTIFSPITDAKTNTTWYGGEIESQAYDHVAPAQRYDEYTSGIAKWLGKTFNDSPKKIDYVLDQYSGVIGDILLPLTADKRKSDNVVETLFSSMVTDATYSNKLSKEFYEIYDEVDFAEETMDNVLVKKHLEKVKTAVRDLNKDIDKINADSSLSDEEKVKRAKEIRVLINRTYKTAIEDYELVKQKAQTVQSAYENVFTTAEVTKTNYKALGLDKDDIGMYAIVYSVGDESYAAQTRDTIDEAQEYLESALERAAFADMYLDAYGAEAAMKAYSSIFYEKATVANALGADYENMYRLLLETRYMSNAEKKKRVDEYLRSMPYPTNVKYLIKYIFGDTTKKTKQRAALALKRSDVDDEIKKEWLKKLK